MKVRKTNEELEIEVQELKKGLKLFIVDELNTCTSIKEASAIWRQVAPLVNRRSGDGHSGIYALFSSDEKKELNALFNAAAARLTTPTTELEKLAGLFNKKVRLDGDTKFVEIQSTISVVETKFGLIIEHQHGKSRPIPNAQEVKNILYVMNFI